MKTEEVNEKKLESFVIANPIYDTAFRKFMGNLHTVKFFIGTILEQQIEDVSFLPQKHPYGEELDYVDFFIFRLYIIASVCTDEGKCEKRLIEVLKSWKTIDVIYFRDYTGNLHTKEVIIDGEKTTMPITTIYILGGDILPEIDCPCIKVGHICTDMMKRIEIKTKSEFIEELAPDCYVIQAGRKITDRRYTTDLDNLLG
ncbi:MAG: hypothetical protein LBK96_05565, partial [Prevotellaceae bacterium]|nr:hypothetical protein [Prevotellaceae bacterium]